MYISEQFYICLRWVSIGPRPTKTRKHTAIASHVGGGGVVMVTFAGRHNFPSGIKKNNNNHK